VYFRHNRKNPLAVDCLIIDEASMVDLAMMSKLVEALPENARLILLGDMDQLSSVEAGSVFGDICAGYQHSGSPLAKSVVRLTHSYRFDEKRGIGKVSKLVNSGLAEEAWEYIQSSEDRQVTWMDLPSRNNLRSTLKEHVLPHYQKYLAATDIDGAFAWLNTFSVLCALRNGFYGANAINALIEKMLRENHVVPHDEIWYQGRPIMVTRNDYQRQLFNGDVGIFFVDPTDDQEKVFFESAEPGQYRKISPGLLPEHESAFAMTVHKSQGSEYDRTLLILPDAETDVLTRELIYTAITRARHEVEIWSSKQIFLQAAGRKCRRNSGLTEKLMTPCRTA
jgi:exodeoxyribonuclease V alpha subunit